MGGKPIIIDTHLTVEFVLNLLAHGATNEEILDEYKVLETEDIRACLMFAGKSLNCAEIV